MKSVHSRIINEFGTIKGLDEEDKKSIINPSDHMRIGVTRVLRICSTGGPNDA